MQRDKGQIRAQAERLREELIARLEACPDDFDALHTLGATLFVLGSHESANNVLVRAIMQADGAHAWTWYWLARNSWAMGDPAAAIMALERARSMEPANVEFRLFEQHITKRN